MEPTDNPGVGGRAEQHALALQGRKLLGGWAVDWPRGEQPVRLPQHVDFGSFVLAEYSATHSDESAADPYYTLIFSPTGSLDAAYHTGHADIIMQDQQGKQVKLRVLQPTALCFPLQE